MPETTEYWADITRTLVQHGQMSLEDIDIKDSTREVVRRALLELEDVGVVRPVNDTGDVWEMTETGEVLIGIAPPKTDD